MRTVVLSVVVVAAGGLAGAIADQHADKRDATNQTAAVRWEYAVTKNTSPDHLNNLGGERWEVCAAANEKDGAPFVILKRPAQDL
jgi:hypothetical protein